VVMPRLLVVPGTVPRLAVVSQRIGL
jgi:hypothetical protein